MRTDNSNPYVGLRPFEIDESLLFFGRNEQIMELLQQLHHYHFVAVVGSSGCGKSSLLRAGVIPALKAGYLLQDSDQWRIAIMRPGQNPLFNLVSELLNWKGIETGSDKVSLLLGEMETNGVQPLLDILVALKEKENKNFFLLVDQFEELFRFTIEQKNNAQKDEANDFVNIILELSRQRRVPFYVVMTMRSDFMGDCTKFYGLPEAMNKSLFLVPKLNRVQMKMAIEGPARLYGGKLNAALISRLLNEVGKFEDELPLLQHTLMRIWDYEMDVDKSGELDMGDYEAIGGMQEGLSKHADEALAKMSKPDFMVAKEIFQALTMIDEHGRKTRRPVLLNQLVELTNAKKAQVLNIVQKFIEGKRSFLILNDVADTDDKIIDISHESLIREWQRLNRWMDEEAESASIYLRLASAAELNAENKKDFLGGSELQLALDWKEKFKPSAVWANRYRKGFDGAMSYLKASEKKWSDDLKEETRRQQGEKRNKKRLRLLALGLITVLVITALSVLTTYKVQKLNRFNTVLLDSLKILMSEQDTMLKIAQRERDTAQNRFKALEEASSTVQLLVNQSSSWGEAARANIKTVNQNLNSVITKSEQDIQRKSTQVKIAEDRNNPKVIIEYLTDLTELAPKLSNEELMNHFYFLRMTTKSVWTQKMVNLGYDALKSVGLDENGKKRTINAATTREMKQFSKHLYDIKEEMKAKISKGKKGS